MTAGHHPGYTMGMPTVWMKFQLPDEESEYLDAAFGTQMSLALWDIDEGLRTAIKYNSDDLPSEALEGVEHARNIVHDVLSERGLHRLLGY